MPVNNSVAYPTHSAPYQTHSTPYAPTSSSVPYLQVNPSVPSAPGFNLDSQMNPPPYNSAVYEQTANKQPSYNPGYDR